MPAQMRHRPTISLTLDGRVLARVRRLRKRIPGRVSMSRLVEEMILVGLEPFEAVADAIDEARTSGGQVDHAKVRDRLAHWAGAQFIDFDRLHDKDEEGDEAG
jgi:hypothetical protein